MTVVTVHALAAHAGPAHGTDTVHDVVEAGLEVGDLRVDLCLGVLAGGDLSGLLLGVVLQQLRLDVGDVHTLCLRDVGQGLAGLELGVQFGGRELQHLRERIGGELRRAVAHAGSAHSLAAGSADVVDERVDVGSGLRELRVCLCLGVLTRLHFLIEVRLQVGEDRGLHVGDVLALLLGDRRERLRLQLGLELGLGQAESLRGVGVGERCVIVTGETCGSGAAIDCLATGGATGGITSGVACGAIVVGGGCDGRCVVLRGEFCTGETGDAEDGRAGRDDETACHCDLRETGLVLHGWGFLCCDGCSPVVPGWQSLSPC